MSLYAKLALWHLLNLVLNEMQCAAVEYCTSGLPFRQQKSQLTLAFLITLSTNVYAHALAKSAYECGWFLV
jgi:multisubunit Na+/H+ antiporter MnhG subunit